MKEFDFSLFDTLSDGVLILNKTQQLVYVNTTFIQRVGTGIDEWLGRDFESIQASGLLPASMLQALRETDTEQTAFRQTADATVCISRRGLGDHLVLIFKEESRRQTSANDTEEQLVSVLDSMHSSFVLVDTNYCVLNFSKRLKDQIERMSGKPFGKGGYIFDFMSSKDIAKVKARLDRALKGESFEAECTFHNMNGDYYVWALQFYHPVYDQDKKQIGVAYHGYNIDQKKQAELDLKRSYERLSMVLEATNDAVWEWHVASDTITWNENFFSIFGYSKSEVDYNLLWWRMNIHTDDREEVSRIIHQAIRDKSNKYYTEFRFKCKNGVYKHVRVSCYILYGEHREVMRIVGSMQDISTLRAQKQELIKQNEILKEVAFIQSHLLRKPMANIAGLYALIQNENKAAIDASSELKFLFGNMSQSIHELDEMIKTCAKRINEAGNFDQAASDSY